MVITGREKELKGTISSSHRIHISSHTDISKAKHFIIHSHFTICTVLFRFIFPEMEVHIFRDDVHKYVGQIYIFK